MMFAICTFALNSFSFCLLVEAADPKSALYHYLVNESGANASEIAAKNFIVSADGKGGAVYVDGLLFIAERCESVPISNANQQRFNF